MSLMDTLDGAFMSQAYGWAFSNPIRKVYYNITVTSLSVVVALAIGTVELLPGGLDDRLGLSGGGWDTLNGLDFETLGYAHRRRCSCVMWATSVADLEAPPDRGPLGRDGRRGADRALIGLRRRRARALPEPAPPRAPRLRVVAADERRRHD